MAMLISVNGQRPVPAASVVVYQDDTPVAVSAAMGDEVLYADGIRDPEFIKILQTIGVRPTKLPTVGPTIKGNIR